MKRSKHGMWVIVQILLLAVLAVACTEEDGTDNSKEADASSAENNPMLDSLQTITHLITADTSDPILYYKRSQIYFELNKIDLAMEDIRRANSLNSKDPNYIFLRGFYYYVLRKNNEARADFLSTLRLDTSHAEAAYHLGVLSFLENNNLQAMEWYKRAIHYKSKEPIYHFALGQALQKQKNLPLAIRSYQNALNYDPWFTKSLNALFNIYINDLGDLQKAKEYNYRILEKDTLHALGRFNMGYYYIKRYHLALSQKEANPQTYLLLAQKEYTRAIRRQPDYSNAFFNRGMAWMELGKYEAAIRDFEKLMELSPTDNRADFMIGSAYEAMQNYRRAKDFYESALEKNPQDRDARSAILQVSSKIK